MYLFLKKQHKSKTQMALPSKTFQNFVVLELGVLENVTNRWSPKEQGAPGIRM